MRLLLSYLLVTLSLSFKTFSQDLDKVNRKVLQDFKKQYKNQPIKILSSTINQEQEGVTYFDIEIIPLENRTYFFRQVFQNEDNWGYKNNSLLNIVKVGPTDSIRYFSGIEPNPYRSYTCLIGDTVVIPVYWDNHVIRNKFTATEQRIKDIYGTIEFHQGRDTSRIDWNPKLRIQELKIVGFNSSYAIHRGLQEESVNHSIKFEAIKAGEFTIQILDQKMEFSIVPKYTKIKKRITHVTGEQWEDATSLTLPPRYKKNAKKAILRVGDTIYIHFMSYVQNVDQPITVNPNIEILKVDK